MNAERATYVAYTLNGVTYLPHYTKQVYVGPGYPEHTLREYTAAELQAAGAQPYYQRLLVRGPKAIQSVEDQQ